MPDVQVDQVLLREYRGHVIGAEKCQACCCLNTAPCDCGGRVHGSVADITHDGDAIHDMVCDKCGEKTVYEEGTGPEFIFVTLERQAEVLETLRHTFSAASNVFPSGPREVTQGPNGSVTIRQPVAQFYEIGGASCAHCGAKAGGDIHRVREAT